MMLEKLWLLGIYLFLAGPPNTTHIMQIQDMLFGPFKSIFSDNISTLFGYQLNKSGGQQGTLTRNDFGVLMYGGRRREDEQDAHLLRNAIGEAFAVDKIKHAWADKLGVFPRFARAALKSKQVRHELVQTADGEADAEAARPRISLFERAL
jgi:hypothetical protein